MSDLNRETKATINLKKAFEKKHITKNTFEKLNTQVKNDKEFNSVYENEYTVTNGLMEAIRQLAGAESSREIYLCSECDHFSSSIMDSGYGCGYRNTQILLSSIRNDSNIRDSLFNNSMFQFFFSHCTGFFLRIPECSLEFGKWF